MNPNGSRDPDILPEQCTEEGHTFWCQGRAGGEHEIDPDWFEDDEGFIRSRLSYENREGDPAFNGAFNAW